MRTYHRHLTWFLMPLFLTGVFCNRWKVDCQQQHMCAVKGSSVVIACSFSSSGTQRVRRVKWGQENSRSFISDSNSTKVTSRFQYIGDIRSNCSLKIHRVEKSDAGKYSARFFTDKVKGIRSALTLTLNVFALNVSVTRPNGSRISKEGDSLNLTCINPCEGNNSSSAVTWFKNGELLHEVRMLYLTNISNSNSGNYTCSLKTQAGSISEVVNIDVEYGPRNTSVSIMEEEGSSVFTLICGSRANPPVNFYSWYKKDSNNEMVVGHRSVLFSSEGGQYFCNAANNHGSQNSSVVIVKIKAYWTTFTRDVLIITTAVVLLIVTTVIVITRLKRKRACEPKRDCTEDVQDTDYVNWLPCDINQSQEGNQREEWTELIYTTVDLINRDSNIRGQQMDSHKDDQSVIYSPVCRPQLLIPSTTEAS